MHSAIVRMETCVGFLPHYFMDYQYVVNTKIRVERIDPCMESETRHAPVAQSVKYTGTLNTKDNHTYFPT